MSTEKTESNKLTAVDTNTELENGREDSVYDNNSSMLDRTSKCRTHETETGSIYIGSQA